MDILIYILGATIINSLTALIGIFTLGINDKQFKKILLFLVAFSAGALMGAAFFHLLLESLEEMPAFNAFGYLLVGFCLFFLIERFLHWHHCHEGNCEAHSFTYLILLGDGIHNFIDGLVIAASFIAGIPTGIITTIAIMSHEIPQELGNYGTLIYGGFTKTKALLFNLLAQMTCILGGLVGFFFATNFSNVLLPFAAGGFIYIAASDLIPELHKEVSLKKSTVVFLSFLFGLAFMILIKVYLE
ncbi:MAG: ZIP family metal transporter [Candidatus Diapherotrites archaeon CG08_land_8_20_14_0_20_34_12]|nr:MAG: ZIP family metal transporter [Candidatus Diapherotrites archaeon CG08_land_8_20_14_0_20_34_12]